MSHVKHETICITSWNEEILQKLRDRIDPIASLTATYECAMNGYHTFYVLPSGSKAGWADAKFHLEIIETIKAMIKELDYDDGSNSIQFIVSEYGDFEG